MSAVSERAAVDKQYRWDLESIYSSDDEWESAFAEAESLIDEFGDYEDRILAAPEDLLDTLEMYERMMREVSTVYAYARMRRDEDMADDHYQALASRGQSLAARAQSAASFIDPAIQSLEWEELAAMIESEPALSEYEHYLEDIHRLRDHTRSTEVERILADLSEVLSGPREIYSTLTNADMTFPSVVDDAGESVEITQANFVDLLKRPNRDFRENVYVAFYDEWETVRNAVATSLETHLKRNVTLARVRGYESAREAALDEPNIPPIVYDTLVETVQNRLDVLHKHAELKRDALGVDELRMWDLYMPVTRSESPTVTYEEATDHIVEAVAPLGENYQTRLAEGLESRWVDVYETPNKRAGAYSGGTYDTQPFILMNYQDTVNSMSTLAHELGHSLHSEFTSEHQPYVYSSYEIFVAEVASTVNETLLTHHLLETVDNDRFRRHVLDQYLENFRNTLYRQTMFADFEQQIHERIEDGRAITADGVDELYGALKAEYYEPATVDERIAREWMRIPHFYYDFYVYQYSTGISAAVAIASRIIEAGEPAAEPYLEFLKSGSREYPLDLLEDVGLDMRTSEPIDRALDVYEEYLDEMATLL